jgi:hypothetical protein
MIPWIQVYSNLITHPKTSALADLLKLTSRSAAPNVIAAGLLVSLWSWAVQNAYSGDLSGCSDRAIADAARYLGKPQSFVAALTQAGWLDPDRKLHNWDRYASLLMEQEDNRRAKTNERVKRYRNKKTPSCNGYTSVTCNAPVTVTCNECNAPTLPNHTKHNHNNYSAHNTLPVTDPPQNARAEFDSQSFSVFWETYPTKNGGKTGREAAWEAWRELSPSKEQAARILSNLKAWKISGQWTEDGDRYIPKAAKFLSDPAYYNAAPAPSKHHAIPTGASGELGEAELEAIRRVLAQPEEEDALC